MLFNWALLEKRGNHKCGQAAICHHSNVMTVLMWQQWKHGEICCISSTLAWVIFTSVQNNKSLFWHIALNASPGKTLAENKLSKTRCWDDGIVQSVIQSVSKSVNSQADGSFELSSKRNSLSPWCINSACALFPTAALLQSKEVGLPSIQLFSFVPMFSRHVRVRYVCERYSMDEGTLRLYE